MQRAMARQAEAERERRAKVIAAEGEYQASERLKDAANVISVNPTALQLRYLQTIIEMSAERTTTMILPLPLELLTPFLGRHHRRGGEELTGSGGLRRDPLSRRLVAVAPARARRPGAPVPGKHRAHTRAHVSVLRGT